MLQTMKIEQLIITMNPDINARKESDESLAELMRSIKDHGIKMPIKVVHSDHVDLYEVVTGFRRIECVRRLKLETVQVEIIQPENWPVLYIQPNR